MQISIEEEDWERVEIVTIGVGIRAKEVMFAGGWGRGLQHNVFTTKYPAHSSAQLSSLKTFHFQGEPRNLKRFSIRE